MARNNIPEKSVPSAEINHHSREARLGLERAVQLFGPPPVEHSGLRLLGIDMPVRRAVVIGGSIIIIWALV
jgi:hypothetical protein